jgi:hypothetical protein
MTPMNLPRTLLLACLAVGAASLASADSISVTPTFSSSNQTAPPDTSDYEGVFYDFSSTFPPPSISIGTFSFAIPAGEVVEGATISGTFGDVNIGTTALTDLFVLGGNIEVAECDSTGGGTIFPPCATGTVDGSLVPWSYTFTSTDLSNLAADFSAGTLDFTAVQNGFGSVVVGTPVLDIQVSPEPGSIFTLAGGLLALAALRLRK